MDILTRNLMWAAAGTTRVSSVSSIYNTFTANAVNNSLSIPGGTIQAGDLIVVWDWAQNSTSTIPTYNLNAQYVQVSTLSTSGNPIFPQYGTREVISYKIADGTETTVQGMTCDLKRALLLEVFRGNTKISQVTINDLQSQVYIESSVMRMINSNQALIPSVVISAYGNWSNTPRSTPALSNNMSTYTSTGVIETTVTTGRDWMTCVFNSQPEVMYASTALGTSDDQLQTFTTFYMNLI